jgi:hypothetical protein
MKAALVLVNLLSIASLVVFGCMLWQHKAWLAGAAFVVHTVLTIISTKIEEA